MKKFLKYTCSVVLCLLVLAILLDVLYTTVISNSIPRNKVRYALSLKNKHYDVLFLGSSRVENSVVTSMFQEKNIQVLNMGLEGATLADNWLMLYLLKNNNVTFDKIFIQLDYLYNSSSDEFSERSMSNLLPLIRDEKITRILKEVDKDYKLDYYIPFYRYINNGYSIGFREFLSSLLRKKPRISFEDGYTPKYGNFEMSKASLPKHIVKKSSVYENLKSLCDEIKIQPIYFIAPYCSQLEDNGYVEKLDSIAPNFHDYSRVIKNDYNFYNCGHLNDKGAKQFTAILLKDFFE